MSKDSEQGKSEKAKARVRFLYDLNLEKGTIKLKNKKCPRCGSIMAFHKSPIERWTCGACSYTDFVKKS
ncbi:MAG: 30S ribosomal protein S27ae [Candidatus Bathyarchaeia archaeon]